MIDLVKHKTMNGSSITLPKKLFEDLVKTMEYFGQLQNELDDFMLGKDKKFLSDMRKARREHLSSSFSDWSKMKSEYGI